MKQDLTLLLRPEFVHEEIKMSAIGSLVFCTDCGNLLDPPNSATQTTLTCTVCGASNEGMPSSRNLYRIKLIFSRYLRKENRDTI